MDEGRDRALVKRSLNGDRQALAALIEAYRKPLFNAAYRILGNSEDAADATQAAFLKAYEHLGSFNPKYKFFSWIYRIALNESINQLKRARKQQPLDEFEAGSGPGPARRAEAGDVSRRVQEGLMELSDDHRTVLVLRHFSDCSYREIGEMLEIPEKTVKSRLYTARQQLKERLLAHGVSP
jgi:RNA polymerase sigma-70 factor (ECF subfamily)